LYTKDAARWTTTNTRSRKLARKSRRNYRTRNDGGLQAQAQRFGTDVRDGWATKVDFSGDIFIKFGSMRPKLHCETVIISTGASAKYLGLPSEQHYLKMGGGVSACAVCDGFL
jgi:thioredoxin reductase